jgi:hypothetical protein
VHAQNLRSLIPSRLTSLSRCFDRVGDARLNGHLLLVRLGSRLGNSIDLRPGARVIPQEAAKICGTQHEHPAKAECPVESGFFASFTSLKCCKGRLLVLPILVPFGKIGIVSIKNISSTLFQSCRRSEALASSDSMAAISNWCIRFTNFSTSWSTARSAASSAARSFEQGAGSETESDSAPGSAPRRKLDRLDRCWGYGTPRPPEQVVQPRRHNSTSSRWFRVSAAWITRQQLQDFSAILFLPAWANQVGCLG